MSCLPRSLARLLAHVAGYLTHSELPIYLETQLANATNKGETKWKSISLVDIRLRKVPKSSPITQ